MEIILIALVAAGALAGDAAAAATVNVELGEYQVVLSTESVPAGKVTFVVKNAGKYAHQFVVIRTTRAPEALPQIGALASERGRVGGIGTFAPGKTRRLTLRLKPGTYVLICNVTFHYKNGQYAAFTVT
jgi:uncharacterized cupredoxin-like copper-binding protein